MSRLVNNIADSLFLDMQLSTLFLLPYIFYNILLQ